MSEQKKMTPAQTKTVKKFSHIARRNSKSKLDIKFNEVSNIEDKTDPMYPSSLSQQMVDYPSKDAIKKEMNLQKKKNQEKEKSDHQLAKADMAIISKALSHLTESSKNIKEVLKSHSLSSKTFEKPKCIIQPNNILKVIWDYIILVCVLYVCTVGPFKISF